MAFEKGNTPWNKNKPNLFTKGKNNHFWKGGKVEKVCANCGKKFKAFPSEIRKNRKYCSHRCYSEKNKGIKHWWSYSHSAEYKLLKSKQNSGKGNPNWQGGISFEFYPKEWTKELRRKIRERDNYTCQICGEYGNRVHHIDYNKKNCDPKNLITLCIRDNPRVNFNREYWIEWFISNFIKPEDSLKILEIRNGNGNLICK